MAPDATREEFLEHSPVYQAMIDELEMLRKAKRCHECYHSLVIHTFGSDGYGDHCNIDNCWCAATDTDGW